MTPISIAEADRAYAKFKDTLVPITECGCLVWTKGHDNFYRGLVRLDNNKSMVQATRICWIVHNRVEIPAGMYVLHTCDFGACCNPAHLYLGTHQDNMNDKATRGRGAGGVPLTPEKRAEIRAMREAGVTFREIQTKFGVSHTTVLRSCK